MAEVSKHAIGLGTEITEEHTEFTMDGGKQGTTIPVVISSAARDASGSPAHSPATKLRKGLVMARLTSGGKWMEYDDTQADGRQNALGILAETVNLLDADGSAQDAKAIVHVMGWYDEDKLYGIDANGKTDLKALKCLFKEDLLPT